MSPELLRRRRRRARSRLVWQWAVLIVVLLALVGATVGFAFSGSEERIADGVTVAGVPIDGLTPKQARARLARRGASLIRVPVTFVAGDRRWRVTPARLGMRVDWAGAVAAASRAGRGFGPLRGLRRLETRFFGTEVRPAIEVYQPALAQGLDLLAHRVDRRHRDARLRLRGLRPVIVSAQDGLRLDREASIPLIVEALASLRRTTVGLPVTVDPARVRAVDLARARAQARRALKHPVRLALGGTRWRVPRWRIARLLQLPSGGTTKLALAEPATSRFLRRLARSVDRPPSDARFAVSSRTVTIAAAKEGRRLDLAAVRPRLLRAALSQSHRLVRLPVATATPSRTTAEARAMGITGLVAGYETIYGGDPNRIHNVQLVAHLVDNRLIAPGATFSFNRTTGERTADKGFLEAPVIINGELQTGLGGGVCQVSTTVFNAAYEAGLPITTRTNHALYISHYPLGRDATVNYPDTDLRFVNDTGHWLLLRTFVGSSSLVVDLYGTPVHRRVETETAPLEERGDPPLTRIPDSSLLRGQTRVDAWGQPPRSTSVHRRVYGPSGELLHDDVWSSYYRGEARVIRYGTKAPPPPPPKPKPEPKKPTATAGTDPTRTGPAERGTGPTGTEPAPTDTGAGPTTPSETTVPSGGASPPLTPGGVAPSERSLLPQP